MKKKTIEDALAAFPEGWPTYLNSEYIGLFNGGFGICGYKKDSESGYKICTKEEFIKAYNERNWKPISGEICEVSICGQEYTRCVHLGTQLLLETQPNVWTLRDIYKENTYEYRPIKSEREKFIEACFGLRVEQIYDAIKEGFVKVAI